MWDQPPEEFDESMLNQPWDPVSYFEDEAESKGQDGDDELSASQSKRLSEIFDDLNLRSVENDIKRIAIRKQQSEDVEDSVFGNIGKDDTEEPSGDIERFITYEDKEDHLKAVDNTEVINRKNIDSDMKRFAHFKQQSLEQSDENASMLKENIGNFPMGQVPEESSIDGSYFDELVKVLPDAIQSEPLSPAPSPQLQDEVNNGYGISHQLDESELDINNLLPDPVIGDNVDNDLLRIDKIDNLIENDSKNENKFVKDGFEAKQQCRNGNFLDSQSGSSQGSGESLNQIIEAAETIVRDYTQMLDPVDKQKSNEAVMEKEIDEANNDKEMEHNLIDTKTGADIGGTNLNVPFEGKHDMKQSQQHTAAPLNLLDGFGFENDKVDHLNTSGTSLHDELRSSSPTFDLCEPTFGTQIVRTSNLIDIEDKEDRKVGDDNSVQVRTSSTERKKGKRKSKSMRPKYVVDVIKSEDSDSDVDFSKDMLSSSQSDMQVEDGTIGAGATAITHGESSVQVVTSENANVKMTPEKMEHSDHSLSTETTKMPFEEQSMEDESQFILEGAKATSEEMLLSEEALQITEQLADEILNDDVTIVQDEQDVQSTSTDNEIFTKEAAGAETVAGSDATIASPAVDADTTSEMPDDSNASLEIPDDTVAADNANGVRTGTRSGSTSDSEDLEEFINQHLNESAGGASATSAEPTGASLLPPLDESMQLGWYAPKWVPDKDARACMNCGLKFTVVKRRHHCRACGKVLCSNCCNMKADLAYLSYKTSRVCQECFEILNKGQSFSPLPLMTGNQDVPGRGHTISLNDSEPGSSSFPLDSPPQYMPDSPPEYSVLPGSAAQSGPPNPPSYFASVRGTGFRSRTESDRSVVIMFNSSQTDLPPILRTENEVVKIINNPNVKDLFQQMKDKSADPVAFLVNKNLVVKVRVVSLDCCVGKECWCFSSDGMGASNQEEIVFLVEYKGDDSKLLKCVFQQFNLIFERAKHGEPLSDFGYIPIDEFMQNNRKNVGMILFKPNVQCVKNILVPCHPYLFGLWIHQSEVPWAKNLPLRLLVRFGAEFKSYPYPVYNVEDREPVFNVVGRTIIALLADFRSFQYALPKISGLLVSVTKKDTTIKLPQTRYDEVLKVLNTSEESVMAFSGNFNRKADSHLVCVETDGTHTTQTISCRTSSKKLTGCSFVVFSASLKSSTQNLQAKASIVEDGIMVQVTSDTMKKIRTAMKEMQDLVTPASEATEGSNEVHKLKIVWGSSDDSSSRTSSPIDGSSFDGLTNMRIRHSYDFTVSTSPAKIHWQEVYFLPNDADTVGRLSAKELSQMTSSVAKACMNALSPHLSTLVALDMTKIGLRMILDSDMVEYRIGANKEQLPQELTGDLDDKLIPVIHGVMKTVSHRRVSAELIFQITRIV